MNCKTGGPSYLTYVGWERRLQSGLALLALDGLNKCRLLTTDVCSRPTGHKHIKVISSVTGILPNQTSSIGLVNRHLNVKKGKCSPW